MIRKVKQTIFWCSLAFIMLTVFSLTVGQVLPIEFEDYKVMHSYYDIIMQGLPIAVLLTLIGTIKKKNSKTKNWILVGLTILTSIISFAIMISLILRIGFGAWTTETILYRHKTERKEIKEQLFDIGALGYGGRRTVQIKPYLEYWVFVTEIDTLKINKDHWEFVNEQGDKKFP